MKEVVGFTLDRDEILLLSAMASLGASIVGTVIGQNVDRNVMSRLVTQLANHPDLTLWNGLQDKIEKIVRAAYPDVQVFDLSGTRASWDIRRARDPNLE